MKPLWSGQSRHLCLEGGCWGCGCGGALWHMCAQLHVRTVQQIPLHCSCVNRGVQWRPPQAYPTLHIPPAMLNSQGVCVRQEASRVPCSCEIESKSKANKHAQAGTKAGQQEWNTSHAALHKEASLAPMQLLLSPQGSNTTQAPASIVYCRTTHFAHSSCREPAVRWALQRCTSPCVNGHG